jgi:hypothetical protein
MNYQTELMRQILTNEKAQEIIDYVSQIYGDSYVGLWFFQAIGTVLEPGCDLSDELMAETSPATATLLLPYYEQEYGLQPDPSFTIEQRRELIMAARRSKGAVNPARLADAVSAALGGAPVEIIEFDGSKLQFTEIEDAMYGEPSGQLPDPEVSISAAEIEAIVAGETSGQDPDPETSITNEETDQIVIYGQALNQDGNLSKNEFVVNIRTAVKSTAPATAVVDRMKPAHLIYMIRGVTQESASTTVYIGTAMTTAEHNAVQVYRQIESEVQLVTDGGDMLATDTGDTIIAHLERKE